MYISFQTTSDFALFFVLIVANVVHQDVNGGGFKSSWSDKSRTIDKLSHTKGSKLVSIRNKSVIESVKRNLDVKEEKRKLAEDYNKYLPEDFVNTDILDFYADSASDNRSNTNHKNTGFVETRKVIQDNESSVTTFVNTDRRTENELTTSSTSQVTKNGNALNQEAPRSHVWPAIRTRGNASRYFRINPGRRLDPPELRIKV